MADPKSWTNLGSVNGMLRTAPPAVGWASNTSTCNPAWASTIAAARPFGPEPTTHALDLFGTILSEHAGQRTRRTTRFLFPGLYIRPLHDLDLAFRRSFERWRITSEE